MSFGNNLASKKFSNISATETDIPDSNLYSTKNNSMKYINSLANTAEYYSRSKEQKSRVELESVS